MKLGLKFFGLLLIAFLALSRSSAAQNQQPTWELSIEPKTAKVGDVVNLVIKGKPPVGWHIYSTKNEGCEFAPTAAELELVEHASIEKVGNLVPIGHEKKYDETYECYIWDFPHDALFKQKVKILSKDYNISGYFYGQMCTDGICVQFPAQDPFIFTGLTITGGGKVTDKKEDPPKKEDKIDKQTSPDKEDKNPSDKLPDEGKPSEGIGQDTTKGDTAKDGKEKTDAAPLFNNTPSYKSDNGQKGECKEKTFEGQAAEDEKKTYWALFLLAFGAGLIALITPCVFPMIPMTVSFFMKDGKSRAQGIKDGLIFALSIVGIFTILGTIVTLIFKESFANWLATHWVPNTLFFLVFILFAAAFFGAFELKLPHKFVNKMDAKADKGGLIGTFFLAFTIVLVSFSCTGPIIGTILVQVAKDGGVIEPIVGMFGFGLAFALPFGLFAIFPQWLNNLPQSGGWLNSVKVILGFLELALALKFLSIPDLTYHWGLLDREVFLAIWIVIFTLMGVYLLGKLKFAHDSDLPFLKVPRFIFAILTFSFVVYLIPGLWGAPLNALSGYLPPMHTQDFTVEKSIRNVLDIPDGLCSKPSYEGDLHIPVGLTGYFDYDEAVACAKEQGKPLLLDFTGHGCANCRQFENQVWAKPKVKKLLKENFLIASLYVDDKKVKLPEDQHYISRFSGRKITTLGRKNLDIEACYFGKVSQPLYVVMDGDENLMSVPRGTSYKDKQYDPDEFEEYLKEALEYFKKTRKKED